MTYKTFYLHDIFLTAVTKWPDRIALMYNNDQWTYNDLYKKVSQYVELINKQITHDDTSKCIAIYGTKSCETVAAILAVLLSGYAYMPLDISWPAHRINTVLDIAKPALLITTQLNLYLQKQLNNIQNKPNVIDVLERGQVLTFHRLQEPAQEPVKCQDLTPSSSPEQIAYLLFTSGSTGTPKGVCMSHRAASAAIEMLFEHVTFYHHDKIANQSAFCYDLSMFDLFSAFKVGASVYLMPETIVKNPKEFIQCIIDNQLTSLFMVNSAIEYILKYTDQLAYKLPLRNLLLTGDPLTNHLFSLFRKRLSADTNIWNLYSAVEMPYAFAQKIALTNSNINFKLFSLHGSKIEFCINGDNTSYEGELSIKSPVVFSGYLSANTSLHDIANNPIAHYKTGDWVSRTENGIELAGRIDRQIKIMGNRIELDDIETNLETLPGLREAAVCYHNNKIIAFLQIDSSSVHSIKLACQKILPAIMHPHEFICVETILRTTSGKKNRKLLMSVYDEHNRKD